MEGEFTIETGAILSEEQTADASQYQIATTLPLWGLAAPIVLIQGQFEVDGNTIEGCLLLTARDSGEMMGGQNFPMHDAAPSVGRDSSEDPLVPDLAPPCQFHTGGLLGRDCWKLTSGFAVHRQSG